MIWFIKRREGFINELNDNKWHIDMQIEVCPSSFTCMGPVILICFVPHKGENSCSVFLELIAASITCGKKVVIIFDLILLTNLPSWIQLHSWRQRLRVSLKPRNCEVTSKSFYNKDTREKTSDWSSFQISSCITLPPAPNELSYIAKQLRSSATIGNWFHN